MSQIIVEFVVHSVKITTRPLSIVKYFALIVSLDVRRYLHTAGLTVNLYDAVANRTSCTPTLSYNAPIANWCLDGEIDQFIV